MDICEQSPSYIRDIAPYPPGKPISELAREMNLDEASIIKLASNENPLGLSPHARAAMEREIGELARYPDGNAYDLKSALSKRYGRAMDSIVVGNGSNDILEMVGMAFLSPGKTSVYSQYTFVVYPLATQARGARGIVVPARGFGHDLAAMAESVRGDTAVMFIANPNNPTGTFASGSDIEALLRKVPANVVVVLDEAYNEYLPENLRYDSVRWLDSHQNLVVVRTFSKAYGLAGLRVGYGLCCSEIAGLLNRVRQPFNVNSLALVAAVAALDDTEFVERSYQINREGLHRLETGFRTLGLDWIPSSGNFVSVRIPRRNGSAQAAPVFEKLLRQGVIVRPVAGYDMPDHLRITVGLPSENERFLKALENALAS